MGSSPNGITSADFDGDGKPDLAVANFNSSNVTVLLNTTTNSPPVAKDDSYSTDEDQSLNAPAPGVLARDTDPDGDPLTAVKESDPSHGTLTLNSDGSFSYTPNSGFSGTDSFTYKANDGTADSSAATVTITVNPASPIQPPAVKHKKHK